MITKNIWKGNSKLSETASQHQIRTSTLSFNCILIFHYTTFDHELFHFDKLTIGKSSSLLIRLQMYIKQNNNTISLFEINIWKVAQLHPESHDLNDLKDFICVLNFFWPYSASIWAIIIKWNEPELYTLFFTKQTRYIHILVDLKNP